MIYEDLYDKITEAGFKNVSLVVNQGDILGIEVESPALQLDVRVNILKEVCGNDFKITGFPNEEIISITHANPPSN